MNNVKTSNVVNSMLLTIGLAVVLWFIASFKLEAGIGLTSILPVMLGGFVVQLLLPQRFKVPFFTLLSLAAFVYFLGAAKATVVISTGFLLFGITKLRIKHRYKWGLIFVIATFLTLIRTDYIKAGIVNDVIPVIASLFMFRIIVFMYEVRFNSVKESIWHQIGYFFLLPNIIFLLFPIVDYKTFVNSFENEDRFKIYQKGIAWIMLGALQLVLYKLAYYFWVFPLSEVENAFDLFNFAASNYSLFIRVNGHFNIAMGVLCLFGFNMPSPFFWFYFAPNFSEIWRRINTYWKEFMQKVFYYPMLFRHKKRGMKKSIIIATLYSFFITYLLHSYQWFWLRGDFLFTTADGAFWLTFGILITLNSVYLLNRKKKGRPTVPPFVQAFLKTVQTVGIFFLMAILVGLWNSPTIGKWLEFLTSSLKFQDGAGTQVLTWFFGIAVIGTALQFIVQWNIWGKIVSLPVWIRSTALTLFTLSLLAFDSAKLPPRMAFTLAAIRSEALNAADRMQLTAGYYESVINVNKNLGSRIGEVEAMRPDNWGALHETSFSKNTHSMLSHVLLPNKKGTFKDKPFSTNSLGLRDKEYPLEADSSTLRAVLVGSSIEMGSGVADDSTFEAIAESTINREDADGRFELLNLSFSGHSFLQHRAFLAQGELVDQLNPDLVILAVHESDALIIARSIMRLLDGSFEYEEPYLANLIDSLKIAPEDDVQQVLFKLKPAIPELIDWTLKTSYDRIVAMGATPVALYVPEPIIRYESSKKYGLFQRATAIGFAPISAHKAYDNFDPEMLQVASWDRHPNSWAHRLIAEQLIQEIRKNDTIFTFGKK